MSSDTKKDDKTKKDETGNANVDEAPEQPVDVILNPADTGTVIGPVHARDTNVEVPKGTDLTPGDDDKDKDAALEADQVEYFQVAGASNGMVVAINGTAFALAPQMVVALKQAIDRAVVGMTL